MLTATLSNDTQKWEVVTKVEGKDVTRTFDNEADAAHFIERQEQETARTMLRRAEEGGKKYAAEAMGRAVYTFALNTVIGVKDLKSKDLTNARIYEASEAIDDKDFEAAVEHARNIRKAIKALTGKNQTPMTGAKLPRQYAESFIVCVKPSTGAAQRAQARDFLFDK